MNMERILEEFKEEVLTVHVGVHVLSVHCRARPLNLWLDDKGALLPGQVHLMLHTQTHS